MKEIKFPLLTKEDIEVRIGQFNQDKTKASLLLYQDARCGMKYLDQVVGVNKWQKKYYEVRGLVICSLGIYDEDLQQWLWKDDTGTAGSIEEEKSVISDSFKRCCVCWGLARELYSSPNIWVEIKSKYDKFYVKSITYNENREIKTLEIENEKHEIVFSYPKNLNVSNNAVKNENNGTQPQENNRAKYITIIQAHEKFYQPQRFKEWLKRMTGSEEYESLSDDKLRIVAQALEKNNK